MPYLRAQLPFILWTKERCDLHLSQHIDSVSCSSLLDLLFTTLVTWLPHYCWVWQCAAWFMSLLVTGIALPCEIRIQERRYSYRIFASRLLHNILFNNIFVCVCVQTSMWMLHLPAPVLQSAMVRKTILCGFIRKSKFFPSSPREDKTSKIFL
jgi:hypothetical protein